MRSEFSLIQKISQLIGNHLPSSVDTGLGDDCAVVSISDTHYQLLTTDSLVEKVHFDLESKRDPIQRDHVDRDHFSLQDVGYKSLAVNLSDIAAMGGKPCHCLVSLGLPKKYSEEDVLKIYEGLLPLAEKHNVTIIGGNISSSLSGLWINITLTGEVLKKNCKKRSGARAGDYLYVTGTLGRAALGFELMKRPSDVLALKDQLRTLRGTILTRPKFDAEIKNQIVDPKEPSFFRSKNIDPTIYLESQCRPRARVEAGQFLGTLPYISSMMDISDGLSSDLNHLLKASKMPGAILHQNKLPREKDFDLICERLQLDPWHLALSGGEDYELLLTVSAEHKEKFESDMKQSGHTFFEIGQTTTSSGIYLQSNHQQTLLVPKGFDHLN